MLPVNFLGPYALLPNAENSPLLLGEQQSWQPGIYFWTFLYNKAHRINFIGCSPDNIAERHNEHIQEFFDGQRKFYELDDLNNGVLTQAYSPTDDHEKFVTNFDTLMEGVSLIRVFFSPLSESPQTLTRITCALAAHLQRLGGRAADWLDLDPVAYDPADYPGPMTIRLGRPAFVASLPDEMHL
jgi:hypothetical protein